LSIKNQVERVAEQLTKEMTLKMAWKAQLPAHGLNSLSSPHTR
jgi:hypothetical protein